MPRQSATKKEAVAKKAVPKQTAAKKTAGVKAAVKHTAAKKQTAPKKAAAKKAAVKTTAAAATAVPKRARSAAFPKTTARNKTAKAIRTVIKGGTVVDGTGLPGYRADVEIVDGVFRRIGKIDGTGAQVIDADGLVVAPGFVDLHTHFDAQLHFEPTASPSSWHGVTTVAFGNCGFSLAPVKPADVEWTLKMLSRVEGMSESALAAGVDFAGGSMAQFLDGLEGRVAVNMASYVGHSAVRRWVMGEAASERTATAVEIAAMQEVLRTAMRDGAIGLSTSQLDIHADHLGRPVPCNFAEPVEIIALSRVLSEFNHGVIEIFPRTFIQGYSDADRDMVWAMAEESGKPIHGNVTGWFAGFGDAWRHNLAIVEQAAARGLRVYPMIIMNPKGVHFSLDNTFIFDEVLFVRDTLTKPAAERDAALRDPAWRAKFREAFANPTEGVSLKFSWDQIKIVERGITVAALATQQGVDATDCFFDTALAEDLTTLFAISRDNSQYERPVIRELLGNPLAMVGSSDGGAHLQTFCGADYTTRLLTEAAPEWLTFEQAVSKLTMIPATAMGFFDRGMIRAGMAADVVLMERDKLGVGPARMVHDFPTCAPRLVFDSYGYEKLLVNGEVILERNQPTGALPGTVIRGGH